DLERSLSNQQPIINPLPLGHSVYLSLDPASESWLDKAHDYAGKAASLLTQNPLSRSYGKVTKS
ncbi:Uncharacterized protein FKW44_023368, partial [Caligus rogercresseyi]